MNERTSLSLSDFRQAARLLRLSDEDAQRFKEMFGCDTARISHAGGKLFLIIGQCRKTQDDRSLQWYRNGEPIHFDYVAEKVIASGDTMDELIASAKEYKRLLGMTWADYFTELCGQ